MEGGGDSAYNKEEKGGGVSFANACVMPTAQSSTELIETLVK